MNPEEEKGVKNSQVSFDWSVEAGGDIRLVAPNSKNSYAVNCKEGSVIVFEGDMAHSDDPGAGKTNLSKGQTQVFTPGSWV